ncbi:hypothetical protein [Aulosira sp. FACHB-615]|uniref:hypothetical protein n=1 Tax=Aulosira sp. FACHB-615 TaxID=2692777 RepID=UPI00168420A6|nr:hypothetical protein [Aulosira sp. FACHB-615]MBD2488935.1 hypothetical protein [Aulosira sp. FACHB-615]
MFQSLYDSKFYTQKLLAAIALPILWKYSFDKALGNLAITNTVWLFILKNFNPLRLCAFARKK